MRFFVCLRQSYLNYMRIDSYTSRFAAHRFVSQVCGSEQRDGQKKNVARSCALSSYISAIKFSLFLLVPFDGICMVLWSAAIPLRRPKSNQ